MKRWLLILLMWVLPLQLSFAAVAPYCAHEEGAAAQHFGHHSHVHLEGQQDHRPAVAKLQADLDCSFCHAATAAALPDVAAMAPPGKASQPPRAWGQARLKSPPAHTPDRPQWPRLA